ncbi:Uncharacterised protein [Actinobacillus pleuropneumoniae]|nr:Uncharacterised protein [Actinobacillus pleuropneumoniae]
MARMRRSGLSPKSTKLGQAVPLGAACLIFDRVALGRHRLTNSRHVWYNDGKNPEESDTCNLSFLQTAFFIHRTLQRLRIRYMWKTASFVPWEVRPSCVCSYRDGTIERWIGRVLSCCQAWWMPICISACKDSSWACWTSPRRLRKTRCWLCCGLGQR